MLHRPPDLDGCPPQLRILIERCLSKEAAARPGPGQIVDFCLARAAGTGAPGQAAPVLAPPGTTARAAPYPPAVPAAGRPVPPRAMVNAVRLMYAGGLLAAAGLMAAVAKASALRAAIRQQYPAAAHGLLGATTAGALGLTVISGLIATIAWLAMARRTRRGRPGVRLWSTALFGVNTLSLIHSWAGGVLTHPAWFFGLAEWAGRPRRHRLPVEPAVQQLLRAAAPGQVAGCPPVAAGPVIITPPGITIQLLDGTQAAAHQDELEAAHAEVCSHPPYQGAEDPATFAARFRVQRRQPGFVVAEARHGGYLVGYRPACRSGRPRRGGAS